MDNFTKRILTVMLFSLPGVFFDFFAGHAFADAALAQNLSFPTHPVLPGTTPAKWTLKLEDVNKVFVENKGQFKEADNKAEQPIEYGVRYNGVEMYFTKSGLTFRHDQDVSHDEEEIEEMEQDSAKKENEEEQFQRQALFLKMTWLGANPNAQIIAEQGVSNYFTYFGGEAQKDNSTIHARAFKKIIYKNIYPDIDVEYFFPENKDGFKYNIILRPKADPALIKMHYTGADKIYQDAEGNITIVSSFGNFTDHAPVTYDNKGSSIRSAFELDGDIVSFKVDAPAISSLERTGAGFVIIDPWLTNPLFNIDNNAYDIDWDYQGNVYAYGGSNPYQLIKLNNAGVILWTASAQFSGVYGDFAIDRFSGNAYLCEGLKHRHPGVRIVELNNNGNKIASNSCNYLTECWRITYNSFTKRGVIGGGGTSFSYQAATFDSGLTSILEANVISSAAGPAHDMALLAMDDTSCYMLSAKLPTETQIGDNTIIKCNLSDLSPVYTVQSGHNFREIASVKYIKTNGFNGMAKSKKYLYTYDGATLKKWNPLNGAFIKSVTISADTFAYGGITVDECNESIYLGKGKSVNKYDSTLTLITSFATPDTVYDVALGIGGNLLSCGKGFVSSLIVPSSSFPPSFSISIDIGSATCTGNDGSALVNIAGGTPPFSYLWTKGGQSTSAITNLNPGEYPVFVYKHDSLNCSIVVTDIAVVTSSSGFTGQSNISTLDCFHKHKGTATENALGGTIPYTYLWMPGGQNTQTATGLAAGTYTVTVKDLNGCQTTDEVSVKSSTSDSMHLVALPDCTPLISTQGGSLPFTYLWTPGGATDNHIKFEDLISSSYSVTVTDAEGCSVDTTFQMPQPWYVSYTSLLKSDTCKGVKGSVTIDLKNDSAYSFIYNFSQNTGTTYQYIKTNAVGILSDLDPGNYRCDISDFQRCKDTLIDFVIKDNFFISAMAFSENTTIMQGESIRLHVSGGSTYLWSTGEKDSGIVVAPLKTTSYIVKIGSGNCELTDTITITVSECGEMFIPNAFSPNNDGNNDVLYIKATCIKSMSFRIFNRWGEKVFEAFNLTSGWDGSFNNKLLNPDIFVYSLEATLNSGEVLTRKGNIVLMK